MLADATAIPNEHEGIYYVQFMSLLSEKRETRRYLEVGVGQGTLLREINADVAVGVDPACSISCNVVERKKILTLIAASSDRFFSEPSLVGTLTGAPDLIFLDGFHNYEFLLRDFINSEAISHPGTLIVLHDCLPLDDVMISRYPDDFFTRTTGTRFEGFWTGDVWKVVPVLQKYRKDLKIIFLDCPPTGLVCISNLDSESKILKEKYLDIVQEFGEVPNDLASITDLHASIQITSSQVLARGSDHSVFFRL